MSTGQTTADDLGAELRKGAFAGTWTLDPARTTVGLKTKAMWGMVPVKGRFGRVAGRAEVSADGSVTGRIEVEAASLDTKMKKRDEHLRSEDFFAVEQHPHIVFEFDSITAAAGAVTATGRLTVRDTTVPLTFPATVTDLGAGEVTLDATVSVDRSTVGLGFRAKGATKMDNTLPVHAVFTRD